MSKKASDAAPPHASVAEPDGPAEDVVLDHFTGEPLLRKNAVQIRLGPGKRVWVPRHCCRET